jgi:hypothetical protein
LGETTATPQPGNCPIQLNQLTKLSRDGEVIGYKLIFADCKYNYNQRPFTMVINRQTSACPVQLLPTYLHHRGCSPGPVFMTVEGVAVPRKVYTANLQKFSPPLLASNTVTSVRRITNHIRFESVQNLSLLRLVFPMHRFVL